MTETSANIETRPFGITPKPVDYNAEIVDIQFLSDTLGLFRIRPSGGEPVDFIPGQYLTLGDNNPAGSTRRAYSIASPPEEKRWYELYIRRVHESNVRSTYPLTHILFNKKPGEGVWLGPKVTGHFTLHHTIQAHDERLRIFVAAGTGLAPFVSIIKSAHKNADPFSVPPFLILHGSSYPHELGYREDLETTLNHLERTGYIPTVSRAHEASDWQGDVGRVETFFDGERLEALEKRLGREPGFINPDNAVIYVCGLQGTIANTIRSLINRGFVPDNRNLRKLMDIPREFTSSLYFEQYDNEPILDLEEAERLGKLISSEK